MVCVVAFAVLGLLSLSYIIIGSIACVGEVKRAFDIVAVETVLESSLILLLD